VGTPTYSPLSPLPSHKILLYVRGTNCDASLLTFKRINVSFIAGIPLYSKAELGFSSGMWRRVDLLSTDVSEERIASIFRVEKSASEERA
jgi:hypothetical protein